MKSRTTARFWALFERLPAGAQRVATKNYQPWRANPSHPSLCFRRLQGSNLFTIRAGDHYRAIGSLAGDTITWVWIGTHAEYDRLA